MHSSSSICMALAPLLLLASANDVFDMKKVPSSCTNICKPINTLAKNCHVNDDRVGGSQNERALEDRCICTNDSFDVATVMPQCADCLNQAVGQGQKRDGGLDRSDLNELNALIGRCGFQSSSYTAAAGSAAAGISVSAIPLTDISQLSASGSPSSGGSGQNRGGSGASATGGSSVRPSQTSTTTNPTGVVSGAVTGSSVSVLGAAALAAALAALMM